MAIYKGMLKSSLSDPKIWPNKLKKTLQLS